MSILILCSLISLLDLLRLRYGPGPRYPLPDAKGLYPLVEAQHHRRFFLEHPDHQKAKDTYWPWNRVPDDNILGTDHLDRNQWKEAPANITVLERINSWYHTHREKLFPMDMENPFINRKYSLAESRYTRDRPFPPGATGAAQLASSFNYLPSSNESSDGKNSEGSTTPNSSLASGSHTDSMVLWERSFKDIATETFSDKDKKGRFHRQLLKIFLPRYAPLGRSFHISGVRSYEDTCYFCRKKGADMDTMVFPSSKLYALWTTLISYPTHCRSMKPMTS